MRKSNSIFKTAFVSESGAELTNNDYFAYVEFDEYACYVLASGITDFESSAAAKEAVEHLILSFEEKPSMAKTSLLQYMKETNERLFNSAHARRLKASVIMVVTDYEKFRYVAAGNVRLKMYRKGRFLLASKDMSLASDLIDKGNSDTVLDRHEERHNLYAYLGKKDFFKPYVSKVQKLEDTDIIALYSRGFWENVDSQEIDEIFSEATDDPQESVDLLEEILLSRQPKDLKSYTVAAIFVNKVYRDPERERKRLFYIKIAIVVLVIVILLGLITYFYLSWRKSKLDNLNTLIDTTIEYMDSANYRRAQESCQEALKLADDLNEYEKETDLKNYLLLCDQIVQGENFISSNNYNSAYVSFKNALKYSSFAAQKNFDYINQKIDYIQDHFDMNQFIVLGDNALRNKDFDEAEGMYLKARERASELHDLDGQQRALQSIEKLYDQKAKLQGEADKKLADKKQMAMSDAMNKGDDLLAAGDFDGAQAAYLSARNLSDNPADRQLTTNALAKVTETKEKKELAEKSSEEELQKRREDAIKLEKLGDEAFDAKDFLSAQMYFMSAVDDFYDLKEDMRAENIMKKYDLAHEKYAESQSKRIQAENTEAKARAFYADRNFTEAQAEAAQAKEIYLEMGMKNKADEMDILLQQISVDAAIAETLK